MILDKINEPNDIKRLSPEELDLLAEEIRSFLVEHVSKTGGHIASNLGVVELTMALHLSFDLPKDRIVWDVGHQSYVHKILTGRKDAFDSLRQFGGLSGFPKRSESETDSFNTGHSSTSISAGLGLVAGRNLKGQKHYVVSVIGDGSLTGGMAYEALNNASMCKSNFIIVLNDNKMSIDENVGGISRYLNSIRTTEGYQEIKEVISSGLEHIPGGGKVRESISRTKSSIKQLIIPGMFFENMGVKYLGPVDGHKRKDILRSLEEAKRVKGPVLVHVCTKKGKGYAPAEKNPLKFHGIGPFDPETGETPKKDGISYTEVFSRALCVIAEKNERVTAVTAAMPDGTGLLRFKKRFPERYFDVGIAEEHAVTFCSALSMTGFIPVFAVYSSFLQRGFDQVVHDVALQNAHVVFCIDRAGIVGGDGETHQGLLDIAYMSMIPGMTVMAPKNMYELIDMLQFAVDLNGPVSIRYPRGEALRSFDKYRHPVEYGKAEYLFHEEEIALLAIGSMVDTAGKVRKIIKEKGFGCTLVNMRFAKPVDEDVIREAAGSHALIVPMEEGILAGGMGEQIEKLLQDERYGVPVLTVGIDDTFVPHGEQEEVRAEYNLDPEHIAARILSTYIGTEK